MESPNRMKLKSRIRNSLDIGLFSIDHCTGSKKFTNMGEGVIHISLYILLGLTVGVLSGLIGIGGGIFIIPALVYLFGFSQLQAQGTTLALLVPPIGVLAAWTYYARGYVDLRMAAFICLGFFFGGLFGARIATGLPNVVLQKIFGMVLLLIAIKMILGK